MLAYLMLLTALCNVVLFVIMLVYFLFYFALDFYTVIYANAFCFHALSWVIDINYLLRLLFCIMYSAINQLVFLMLCSHHFL